MWVIYREKKPEVKRIREKIWRKKLTNTTNYDITKNKLFYRLRMCQKNRSVLVIQSNAIHVEIQ